MRLASCLFFASLFLSYFRTSNSCYPPFTTSECIGGAESNAVVRLVCRKTRCTGLFPSSHAPLRLRNNGHLRAIQTYFIDASGLRRQRNGWSHSNPVLFAPSCPSLAENCTTLSLRMGELVVGIRGTWADSCAGLIYRYGGG